jgi:cytochrome c553
VLQDFQTAGQVVRTGQRLDYLVKALTDFRAGVRRGHILGAMMEVSITLHGQDIEMTVNYLARQP